MKNNKVKSSSFFPIETRIIYLGLIYIIGFIVINENFGHLSPAHALECEYYNVTECGTANKGPCEKSRRNITCGAEEPSRKHSCFVVWKRTNRVRSDKNSKNTLNTGNTVNNLNTVNTPGNQNTVNTLGNQNSVNTPGNQNSVNTVNNLNTVNGEVVNDDNEDEEVVHLKGCFINNPQCIEGSCVDRNLPLQGRRGSEVGGANGGGNSLTMYCCCNENYCNHHYLSAPHSTVGPPATSPPKPMIGGGNGSSSMPSILILTLMPLLFLICCSAAWFLHKKMRTKNIFSNGSPHALPDMSEENSILLRKPDSFIGPPITLVEMKAGGRFGTVWRGRMGTNEVAVKILSIREKCSWKLEQEVFSLPLMGDNSWILSYYGARRVVEGDSTQLWLVTEYLTHGSLYDYLKGNLLTWDELLRVGVSMCEGLAFLHEEIDSPLGFKPGVAHRDFKSKNVLLRSNLTSCIADFGLAHIFYPTQPVGTSHGQVGTRRYMAPEVLEGAVNFTRDNFQRIDMYACALVLWELATRCSAQKGPIGEYRLPFEEFIGQQPSLEEIQEVVVNKRKRPTIREDWVKDQRFTVLVEAMKDAWDQDAEARISASCIVERLTPLLQNSHHKINI